MFHGADEANSLMAQLTCLMGTQMAPAASGYGPAIGTCFVWRVRACASSIAMGLI